MLPIEFSPASDALIDALEVLPVHGLSVIMHEVDKRFDEYYANQTAERARQYRERIAAAHARIKHVAVYPNSAVAAGMIAAIRRVSRLDKIERFIADNDRYSGIPTGLLSTILCPRIDEFAAALRQVMETHAQNIATLDASYEDILRTVEDEQYYHNPLLRVFLINENVRRIHDERCHAIAAQRFARNQKARRYIKIARILLRNARWQLKGLSR